MYTFNPEYKPPEIYPYGVIVNGQFYKSVCF